ncbi:MAG: hypothetical protein IJ521_11605 [Schwartzia sp.]|nr:hypothetical protein [Schwartzia sp. (in: firmicutes)]
MTTKVSRIVSAKAVGGSSSGGGIITNGMTEITSSGVWTFADDYTGNLAINADNVTLVGASTTLNEVYITDNSTNLYMKNVKINNTQDKAAIAFTGTTGKLHVLGSNSITSINPGEIWNNAIINSSGDMKLVGTGSLDITRSNSGALWGNDCGWDGAIIGGNASQTCGDISIGTGVTVNITGDYTGSGGCSDHGAAVGSGHNGSCGDISIGSSSIVNIYQNNKIAEGSYSGSAYAAGIGAGDSSGSDGTHSSCGNITLYSEAAISIIREGVLQAPCIGSGRTKSSCGDITIYSSTASPGIFTQNCQFRDDGSRGRFASTMVGPGPDRCTCGDITVRGDTGLAKNFASKYIGTTQNYGVVPTYGPYGANSTCESVYMSAALEFVYSNDADELDPTETYYEVTTETITTTTTTVTTKEIKTTDYETVTETITGTTTTVYEPKDEIIERYNAPLIIHTGTKANQHLRVYIEDMRPEALGIDKAKIDPQEAAIESLAIIDGAIDYAIEQATHLGAYISRLGHTENTLTADSENTQASESTIRDADMALEMLHYTKDNILAQTAQAMLA